MFLHSFGGDLSHLLIEHNFFPSGCWPMRLLKTMPEERLTTSRGQLNEIEYTYINTLYMYIMYI